VAVKTKTTCCKAYQQPDVDTPAAGFQTGTTLLELSYMTWLPDVMKHVKINDGSCG
jgi:hypothetical protein